MFSRYPGHRANFHFPISIRAKVRDFSDGYNASEDYWLRCLYEGENGDPENVEKGFLKSTLLVKVQVLPLVFSCAVTNQNQPITPMLNRPFR